MLEKALKDVEKEIDQVGPANKLYLLTKTFYAVVGKV